MSNNFHEGHWGQCLELLSHLCQYSEDILLVSGPSGIGKTTMQLALIEIESQNFTICDVTAMPDLTAEQLTEQIDSACDNIDKKDILLLIDDAQHLSFEVIDALLQLKQKVANPLHIVLFATAELEQKIARSALKANFEKQVHTIEIEPLTVMELEAFLMHQWRNMYNNNDLKLNKAKYKKIHAASNGVPGRALQAAKEVLSGKTITTENATPRLSPFTVGVAVSFGILFCVLAFMWPSRDEPIETASTSSMPQPLDATILAATAESIDETSDVYPEVMPTPESSMPPEPYAAPEISTMPEPLPMPDPYAIPEPSIIPEPSTMPEPLPVEPNKLDVQPIPSPDVLPQPELVSKVSDDEKIVRLEKKLQVLQEQLNNEQTARRLSESKLQAIKSQPVITTPKTVSKKRSEKSAAFKPKPKPKTLSFSKQELHILSFPSRNFALQLLGSNNESKVQAFIRDNNLNSKAFYYKGIHKGQSWYVVVSGNYASKFEAQQAASRLPYELKKLHPWPREYSKIHNSIKARNTNE